MVRTLKDQVEYKYGHRIPSEHPFLVWLINHAGNLLSRYHLDVDGKTPYERLKGKKFGKVMYPIGQCVHYLPLVSKSQKLNKLEPKWSDGVFLGMKETTSEYLVGTNKGVVRTRSIKLKPPSEQYDWEFLKDMVGFPWQPTPKDSAVTDIPTVIMEPTSAGAHVEKSPLPEDPVPRQLCVNKGLLVKYGYTEGCPGCDAHRAGKRTVAHSKQCRQRISDELDKTESGKK